MKSKGFTILELLLVLSLVLIFFGLVGMSFTNSVKDNMELSKDINRAVESLSVYNQLSKQLFSAFTGKSINIKLEKDRLSFCTFYPLFFSGCVRAEYYVEEKEGKKRLVYEEFPYCDGNLGLPGLKKEILAYFDNIRFEAYRRNRVYDTFSGKEFPDFIKLSIDNEDYFIHTGR